MNIEIFQTEEEFREAAVSFIFKILQKNPDANIALSGGTTPAPIYKALAKKFPQGNFYQVDERYVPPHHPDSNQKMIRETLNPANFHYFDTTIPLPTALEKYEKELPKEFDLTILGIGEDGHYASIFPNTPQTEKPVSHTTTENFPIKDRMTITLKPILKSKNILILLKNKHKVLQELQSPAKNSQEFPALNLLKHEHLEIFVLN